MAKIKSEVAVEIRTKSCLQVDGTENGVAFKNWGTTSMNFVGMLLGY